DMVHWIVGYGPHATVIEPEELRRKVAEWARGAAEANMSPEGATTGAYPELRR
ncbi:MAG: WYL domain-containing protein, partial [bacterium]|nr:WYL domain-containing protein [bacterium]